MPYVPYALTVLCVPILAWTVLYVPYSLDSEGAGAGVARGRWLAGLLAGWLAGRRQRENAMVGGKVRTDR